MSSGYGVRVGDKVTLAIPFPQTRGWWGYVLQMKQHSESGDSEINSSTSVAWPHRPLIGEDFLHLLHYGDVNWGRYTVIYPDGFMNFHPCSWLTAKITVHLMNFLYVFSSTWGSIEMFKDKPTYHDMNNQYQLITAIGTIYTYNTDTVTSL